MKKEWLTGLLVQTSPRHTLRSKCRGRQHQHCVAPLTERVAAPDAASAVHLHPVHCLTQPRLVKALSRHAHLFGVAVLARFTSSNGRVWKAMCGLPSRRAITCSAAARPISTMGVRMLVSAGVCVAPRSVLSTPVIEISLRNRHARAPARHHGADGKDVVGGNDGGRPRSAPRVSAASCSAAAARSMGPYCA